MRKITFLLLLGMAILSSAFCQDSLKIGFSLGDFSSDRWSQEPQIFNAAARDLGATVLFEYAYGDAAKQLEQVSKLITSGIKVLVVFPTHAEGWEGVVETAHKAGVKVVAYDRMLKNADVDCYVSFFNEDVGKQQAQYALDRHPTGNYILLEGPTSDVNSLLFLKGQLEILQPHVDNGEIKILVQKHLPTWNSIDAYNEIQLFLEEDDSDIDAILASNDDLAGGCILALDMILGTWDILITGQDATISGCQNIIDGKQSMTVYKSITNLAKTAAKASMNIATGAEIDNINGVVNNGMKDVPSVLLETEIVDSENLTETVIAEGFVKAEDLSFKPGQ